MLASKQTSKLLHTYREYLHSCIPDKEVGKYLVISGIHPYHTIPYIHPPTNRRKHGRKKKHDDDDDDGTINQPDRYMDM